MRQQLVLQNESAIINLNSSAAFLRQITALSGRRLQHEEGLGRGQPVDAVHEVEGVDPGDSEKPEAQRQKRCRQGHTWCQQEGGQWRQPEEQDHDAQGLGDEAPAGGHSLEIVNESDRRDRESQDECGTDGLAGQGVAGRGVKQQ